MSGAARWAWLAAAVALAAGCGGKKAAPQARLVADVVDVSGAAVAGVKVSVSLPGVYLPLGGQSGVTGDDGRVTIDAAPATAALVVLAKDGYVKSSRQLSLYDGAESYLRVTMMPLAAAQPLSSDTGGRVSGARGAALEVPPGAFATSSGAAVSGAVQVRLTPYDPAIPAEALAIPGELVGLDPEGKRVLLKSYGVLDVTVTQGGQVLRVREGQHLVVRVPMTSIGEPPSEMPMWRYDTQRAVWLGLDAGVWDAASRTWGTTIGPGYALDQAINSDGIAPTPTCIQGVVVDPQFGGVGGLTVTAQQDPDAGMGAQLYSTSWPSTNGVYCMTVERNTPILLTVREASGRVTERRFRSGDRINRDYPEVCGSDACKILPPIVLGSADLGESAQCGPPDGGADAGAAAWPPNPFLGTCAAAMDDFADCFQASGKCFSDVDPGIGTGTPSSEITFENGARVTSEFELLRGSVTTYYGPGGEKCAEVTGSGDSVTYELPDGTTYTSTTDEFGNMKMTCNGGASFTLDAEQVAMLMGCTQGGEGGASEACTAKPGSFGGACTFDLDCKHELSCCGSPYHPEKKECSIESLCDLLCEEDIECPYLEGVGPQICCASSQGLKVCLPDFACQ